MGFDTLRTETIISFDGTPLHVNVSGDGPIDFLLCDGIGCAGFVWRYLRPVLERYGRVLHLHMRGHGQSGRPTQADYTHIRHLADDWSVVLAALGGGQAVAIGHSMGVQVSLELWKRHRSLVDGLVLMCGSYQNPVSTFHDGPHMERLLPILKALSKVGGRPLHSLWQKALRLPIAYHVARVTEVHPDLTRKADFEPYLKDLAEIEPALFFQMLACAGEHSAAEYLNDIDVPTLVVAAGQDQFTPSRLSEEMAKMIPGASLHLVQDATHSAPIEFPSSINDRVLAFLEESDLIRPAAS